MPYFRRAGHVGLLVGASIFTYGFGGLVYWLARRKHLVCPRCGLGWENASRALAVTGPEPEQRLIEQEPDEKLPSAGVKRRVLGTAMVLFASFLVLIGFVEWEMAAVAIGSVGGAAGSGMFYWGWQALQNRRKALMQGLERKILKLAGLRGGRLTVTEVAADMNLPITTADKILTSMDDGFRIRSDISKEGVLYYEFPELLHRKELGSGD
jgi:Flp pilus assembly protein TadB